MENLILTTDVSSAGRLKASRISTRVIGVCPRLVEGPLPSEAALIDFFGSVKLEDEMQDGSLHWQSWIGLRERQRAGTFRPSLTATCQEYAKIEIWIDPVPNSYLVLCQLIDALKSHPDILKRVTLVFPSRYLGGLSEEEFEQTRPSARPLTSEQLDLASRAWHAHNCDTPEAWIMLLRDDLAEIPGLRTFILRILAELPSATNGLSATEAHLLTLIQSKDANHSTIFTRYLQSEPRPTLDYWEAGRRIVSLSQCEPPVIIGVGEDSFSLDLHDDKARVAAYHERAWSLSNLGQRIVEDDDDLTEFIPMNRWLGNTHLTPDRLWRWDSRSETLVEP